jgi:K+-transporting ATPase KdpF subunit
MKFPHLSMFLPQISTKVLAEFTEIWSDWRRQKLPLYLFLGMCFNLLVAPVVYAATGEQFSRTQAWSLGLLGLVTLSLGIYLFFVMFLPEKFS